MVDLSNNPRIGWDNLVATTNVSADTADSDYPVTNLANPNTSSEWRGASAAAANITIVTGRTTPIDYIGIAKHNFGSAGIGASLDARTSSGGAYSQIVPPVYPDDDRPLFLPFPATAYYDVKLKLTAGSEAARAAVAYVGASLTLERAIWVGHTPITYGRRVIAVDGIAESGDFLGAIVTGEYRETVAKLTLLDPARYRSELDAFLAVAVSQRKPFFWLGRPATYPWEAGYLRLINSPDPMPVDPHHLIDLELQMRGLG